MKVSHILNLDSRCFIVHTWVCVCVYVPSHL